MASKPRPASKPGMASKGPYGQQTRYGQQDPVWPAKPGMTSKPGSPNLPSQIVLKGNTPPNIGMHCESFITQVSTCARNGPVKERKMSFSCLLISSNDQSTPSVAILVYSSKPVMILGVHSNAPAGLNHRIGTLIAPAKADVTMWSDVESTS